MSFCVTIVVQVPPIQSDRDATQAQRDFVNSVPHICVNWFHVELIIITCFQFPVGYSPPD